MFCDDGLPRIQRVALEDHAPVGAWADDLIAFDEHDAGGRFVQTGDDGQQRRLPAAGGADQADQLAAVDLQVDLVESDDLGVPATEHL